MGISNIVLRKSVYASAIFSHESSVKGQLETKLKFNNLLFLFLFYRVNSIISLISLVLLSTIGELMNMFPLFLIESIF